MTMTRLLTATVLVALASYSVAGASSPAASTVQIELKQGWIEGVLRNVSETRFFYSFRGIPYVKPPVGELRFKPPVPLGPWTGIRQGVEPSACPQLSLEAFLENKREIIGNEDCLYLNVYTPEPLMSDLPVMVFIHGGGFVIGDADSFGGTPELLLAKDVVLVSVQYRLGSLGFLSTGDSVLPGNLGLMDQTEALRWVKNNIAHFGGDPNKVTIFGESAGAGSVHYQMLTPYSEGLFQRAIMQSGSALCPWAVRDDHAEVAVNMARDFKCHSADSSSPPDSTLLLDCFMKASIEDLVLGIIPYQVLNLPFLMVPRVDGDYIPDHPGKLIKEGRYHKVDLMSGICQHEAAGFTKMLFMNEEITRLFVENFTTVGPIYTYVDNEDNSQYLSRRIMYNSLNSLNITTEDAEALQKMLADDYFTMGHDESTIFHARDSVYGKNVYRYELQHLGENSVGDLYNSPIETKWISHGDDIQYLFYIAFGQKGGISNPRDVFLSEIMVDLWTNFAATGNPTPTMALGFKWEAMKSPSDLRFLSLNLSPEMKEDNRADVREFWRNLPLKRNKFMFPERFVCEEEVCKG